MKTFEKMCTPAKIYFCIAVIATLYSLFIQLPFGLILVKLFFALLWTFLLSGLCRKGYKSLSWFLVLFPYVIMLLLSANILKNNEILKMFNNPYFYIQEGYSKNNKVRLPVQFYYFIGFLCLIFLLLLVVLFMKMFIQPVLIGL